MSDKGKLAETLAESIAEKLGDSDMFLDKRFDSIIDALQDIQWGEFMSLKRVYDSQELYNNHVLELITAAANIIDAKNNSDKKLNKSTVKQKIEANESIVSEDIFANDETTEEMNDNSEAQSNGKSTPLQKTVNRLETNQYRILGGIENIKKDNKDNTEKAIKESEKRIHTRTVRMERSIKRTVKSRLGKLWSMFKKVLIVGLLLFFGPSIKNALSKVGEKLAYVFEPMVNWFKTNFPTLYGYIEDLTDYIGNLASDFSWIVDKLKGAFDWTEEHKTGLQMGAGALGGAATGAWIGSMIAPGIGTAIGGGIGFIVGGGAAVIGSYMDKEKELDAKDAADAAEAAKPYEQKRAEQTEAFIDKWYKNAPDEEKDIIRAYVNNDERWFDTIPENYQRLARDGKYEFNDSTWLEYSKAHGNTKTLPTWDQWSEYVNSKNPTPDGGEDFNPESQGGAGGATPGEPISAAAYQQVNNVTIINNNINQTESFIS